MSINDWLRAITPSGPGRRLLHQGERARDLELTGLVAGLLDRLPEPLRTPANALN